MINTNLLLAFELIPQDSSLAINCQKSQEALEQEIAGLTDRKSLSEI
tara:strand:+ start:570 stop:710 length:141 start_codon:yes stop_codon:yes gene_type:complete